MRKFLVLLMLKLVVLALIPSAALRQDANASADYAAGQLDVFVQREQQQRRAQLITGLVSAAVALPPGIVLARRSNALQHSIGMGLTIGGAAPLLFSLRARKAGPLELLSNRFDQDRASDPAQALAQLERAWEQAAIDGARHRRISGAIHTSLGVLSSAAGLVFLLAPAGKLGVSDNKQYTIGSALMGPGLPFTLGGLRELLVASLEETSWQSYQAARSSGRIAAAPRLQIQGAGGSLSFSF